MEKERTPYCNNLCNNKYNRGHFWTARRVANYSIKKDKYFYDDWICKKCNKLLFGSKPSCQKCGTKRPQKNDWTCCYHTDVKPKYGELNFAKRDHCRKCEQPERAYENSPEDKQK